MEISGNSCATLLHCIRLMVAVWELGSWKVGMFCQLSEEFRNLSWKSWRFIVGLAFLKKIYLSVCCFVSGNFWELCINWEVLMEMQHLCWISVLVYFHTERKVAPAFNIEQQESRRMVNYLWHNEIREQSLEENIVGTLERPLSWMWGSISFFLLAGHIYHASVYTLHLKQV